MEDMRLVLTGSWSVFGLRDKETSDPQSVC
jgi:hypothetical protein